MKYEKYVFIKELKNNDGIIPIGTELYDVDGVISLNGGMLPADYQFMFRDLINKEIKNGWTYIQPDKPIYNKC